MKQHFQIQLQAPYEISKFHKEKITFSDCQPDKKKGLMDRRKDRQTHKETDR